MNLKKLIALTILSFFVALTGQQEADSQSNELYRLCGDLFAGGGRSEGDFILQGVIGALAAGKSNNDTYLLRAGSSCGTITSTKHLSLSNARVSSNCLTVELIVDEAEGVAGVDAKLTYNATDLNATNVEPTHLTSGFSLSSNLTTPGSLVISMADDQGLATASNAALLKITFDVVGTVTIGSEIALTINKDSVRVFDELTHRIPVTVTDESLIAKPFWGNVDDSNDSKCQVDEADASPVLQHVVGLTVLTGNPAIVADVTGDGTISALDAAFILMYAVGAITKFPVENQAAPALASLTFSPPRFRLPAQPAKPGERVHIPIQLEGGVNIVAGEFTVTDPSGLVALLPPSGEGDGAGKTLTFNATPEGIKVAFARARPLPSTHTIAWLEGDVSRTVPPGAEIPLTVTEVQLNERAVTPEVIAHLEVVPLKTRLLPNYPNPFNPETWIPYHLSETADVTIILYDVNGQPVRHLRLGVQPPRAYVSRDRAAYWDGRNEVGERVASGVYFYELRAESETGDRRSGAGTFTEIRKLVILK